MQAKRYSTPLVLGIFATVVAATPVADGPLLGFTTESTARQLALESRFDAGLNKQNLQSWMQRLSARPHHVGSPYGKANAQFIDSLFRSWGYDTKIEQFDVLFPTPKTRVLELISPTPFAAKLAEPALTEDPTSNQSAEQLPVYNAYSTDGDVTGELVYVNYGIPRDYDSLAIRGIDVKGKIVIARYGQSWRGIKPKVAAEHGAIGCIIYSDPRDDGYFAGDVYPKGAFRSEYGAQRGAVQDMPTYPGDPLTPGVGATKMAKRLDVKNAATITKIPVLPISYADALPFLRALGGPVAPSSWRGALPITYHLGPGPAKVHLKLEFNWDIKPAYDVVATMRGSERPDEWIIRGNHHDAWVNGADDPISGLVALMEEARGVASLAKSGWKPKRTIVFAAWDAEEPGLLGSTEWVEEHAELLSRVGAVYINSDTNGRGFLNVGGSHTLERFVSEVARSVTDPQTKVSVFERALAAVRLRGTADEKKEALTRTDLRIDALGSGSDYTPFIQHLGIASLNIGFGGEDAGGSYHSIYDSFAHYKRFGDPGFEYGIALSKVGGRMVLRLANADVLPLAFSPFSETVGKYLKEVTKLANDTREETETMNALVRDRVYQVASDPTLQMVAPKAMEPVPAIDFSPLQTALSRLERVSKAYDSAAALAMGSAKLNAASLTALDKTLMRTERALTAEAGLPRRSWFRHQIYAPGYYTGYGVKTLPGVREAIEQRNWQETNAELAIIAKALDAMSAEIEKATKDIGASA